MQLYNQSAHIKQDETIRKYFHIKNKNEQVTIACVVEKYMMNTINASFLIQADSDRRLSSCEWLAAYQKTQWKKH